MKRCLREEGSWPATHKLEWVVKSGDPDDPEFYYEATTPIEWNSGCSCDPPHAF
jgi:hypothetical protein